MSSYVYEEAFTLAPNQNEIVIYLDYAGDGADDQSGGYREGSAGELEQNKYLETQEFMFTYEGQTYTYKVECISSGDEDTASTKALIILKDCSPNLINFNTISVNNITDNRSLTATFTGPNTGTRFSYINKVSDVDHLIPYRGRDYIDSAIGEHSEYYGRETHIILTFSM